jgi:hypothetical protein
MLLYIIHNIKLKKLLKNFSNNKYHNRKTGGASVFPTSEVFLAATLVLLMVGNYEL